MSSSASAFTEGLKLNSQFLVFSHSWTGKIALIFGMNEEEIILFDATTVETTVKERWLLADIKDVTVSEKSSEELLVRSHTFDNEVARCSREYTNRLLVIEFFEVLRCRSKVINKICKFLEIEPEEVMNRHTLYSVDTAKNSSFE